MLLAPRWRVLDSGAADGATNMATDVALMARAATSGEAVLRVYAWSRPTVSFGVHERARFTPEALAADGLDAVRRPTGGRALLHHREVTYSVTAPLEGSPGCSIGESVRGINAVLLAALRRLGVTAHEAPRRHRATAPTGAACFAEPNLGEIVADGGKLVGSAQRRDEHSLLQHGSLLLADDQSRLGASAPATLNALLGRNVAYGEVRDALTIALVATVGRDAVSGLAADELAEQVVAARPRFLDPKWTWRR
ncbi:MAG: hypothetical protein WD771_02615 [Gemmatimonadaceae bacterium]